MQKNIAGFCLASFFNDWCHEMGTSLLPTLIPQLVGIGYAPVLLGVVQGVSDVAATAMRLFSGYMADKLFFYKPLLVVCYGLTGVCMALIGTAQTIGVVLLYKSIAWMSRGMREPLRDTWISKIVLPTMYGRIFGIQRAFDTLGALIAPLCVLILLKMKYSIQSIFLFSLVPGLLSMLPIIVLTQEKKEQVSDVSLVTYRDQLKQLPREFVFFIGVMLLFGCANFSHVFLLYRVQQLLAPHETFSFFATMWAVALYILFNIARGISEFGIGWLSDYIDRRMLLAVFGFGCFGMVSMCCIASTTSLWFWGVVFGAAGISVGTVKALEKAYAAYILPEHVRGTGLGLLQAIDGVGDLLSSGIVGLLWVFGSPAIALEYAAVLSFAAMIILGLQRFE